MSWNRLPIVTAMTSLSRVPVSIEKTGLLTVPHRRGEGRLTFTRGPSHSLLHPHPIVIVPQPHVVSRSTVYRRKINQRVDVISTVWGSTLLMPGWGFPV